MPPLALELHEHWSGWLAPLVEPVSRLLFGEHASMNDKAFIEANLYAWIFVIPLLSILCIAGTAKRERVPGGLQNLLEAVVSGLESFCRSIVGEMHYRRFVPFVGAIFIYVFALSAWGLMPGMQAATSTVNQTAALALCTFVVTQYAGFGFAGIGYLKHFAGEPLWLAPLMIPIHLVGELARPISLTFRLFGNIGGEDKAIAIFISLGLATGVFLPFQLPLVALGFFTSFIQALIFAVLSAVYIAGALPHENHGNEKAASYEHAQSALHGHQTAPAH